MEKLSRKKQRSKTKWNYLTEFIHVFFYIFIFSYYQGLNAFLAVGPVDTMHSCLSLDFPDEGLKHRFMRKVLLSVSRKIKKWDQDRMEDAIWWQIQWRITLAQHHRGILKAVLLTPLRFFEISGTGSQDIELPQRKPKFWDNFSLSAPIAERNSWT